jgi:hypothetical protein
MPSWGPSPNVVLWFSLMCKHMNLHVHERTERINTPCALESHYLTCMYSNTVSVSKYHWFCCPPFLFGVTSRFLRQVSDWASCSLFTCRLIWARQDGTLFNSSTEQTEAGRSLWVWGLPGLHGEFQPNQGCIYKIWKNKLKSHPSFLLPFLLFLTSPSFSSLTQYTWLSLGSEQPWTSHPLHPLLLVPLSKEIRRVGHIARLCGVEGRGCETQSKLCQLCSSTVPSHHSLPGCREFLSQLSGQLVCAVCLWTPWASFPLTYLQKWQWQARHTVGSSGLTLVTLVGHSFPFRQCPLIWPLLIHSFIHSILPIPPYFQWRML